jgi:hypothetical protein
MTCPEVLQRAAAVPLFHLVGRGQAYRTPVLIFLNVIPDELLSQPNGLPGCKLSILEEQTMADGEPSATLITGYSRHFNEIGDASPVVLPHTLSHSLGPLLLRVPEPYHRGSRG